MIVVGERIAVRARERVAVRARERGTLKGKCVLPPLPVPFNGSSRKHTLAFVLSFPLPLLSLCLFALSLCNTRFACLSLYPPLSLSLCLFALSLSYALCVVSLLSLCPSFSPSPSLSVCLSVVLPVFEFLLPLSLLRFFAYLFHVNLLSFHGTLFFFSWKSTSLFMAIKFFFHGHLLLISRQHILFSWKSIFRFKAIYFFFKAIYLSLAYLLSDTDELDRLLRHSLLQEKTTATQQNKQNTKQVRSK